MNSKVKAFLIFVVGLVVGSIATFIVIGKITQRQFALQYSTDVIEQAVLAIELRANKQEELAKRIETRLPSYVLAIHQNPELRDAPNAQLALWRVKEFYIVNSIAVPDEISGILNNLPAEPPTSCCLK
jgi:hypothetical protein